MKNHRKDFKIATLGTETMVLKLKKVCFISEKIASGHSLMICNAIFIILVK